MPPLIRTYCWLLVLLFWRAALAGAEPPDAKRTGEFLIHSWQTDDGLPENWVSSITQTPDGYLWIGTRYGGLARFDGVRFTAFNPANNSEFKDVQVEYVDVDKSGTLWVIMGNESVTAWRDGRFTLCRQPRTEPRLRAVRVLSHNVTGILFSEENSRLARLNLAGNSNAWEVLTPTPPASTTHGGFFPDRAGVIWYITQDDNLGRFADGKFSALPAGAGLPRSKATALAADTSGRLWAATTNQIFCWNGAAFVEQTPVAGPQPANIRQISACPDGSLWVLDGNCLRKTLAGAWVVNARLDKFVRHDNNPPLSPLYSDAEGNAWLIDYGHGLWCAKTNGAVTELTEADGLPNTFITCWFQDREANVWIGMVGGGVVRISQRVVHVLGPADNLPGKTVRSVCLDSAGALWAGTMSGNLAYWQNGRFNKFPLPGFDEATPRESITACPNHDGDLWIGSLRDGLMLLHAGQISRPVSQSEVATVRILFEDSQRRMWIGGLANLFCYTGGRLKPIGTENGFQSGIAIGAMAEDAGGTIWIATGPGDLWKFQGDKFTRFPPPREWPSFRFSALKPDAGGVIWIGTLGGGLLRFENGHFSRYTARQGLPNDYVSQLLEDDQGHLWAGTYGGIVRLGKANLNAVADGTESQLVCWLYGRSSGLPALECSSGFQPSCWKSPGGRLWFSTAKGLAFIEPRETDVRDLPPSVIIEEMQVDGLPQPIAFSAGDQDRELPIKPGQHFVQFRFTGLSFVAPDEVRFRGKLEGAESQWQDLNNQRTVEYGPLAPGHYRLRIQACNREGLWNEQGASLAFHVLPFIWQTWWFKAFVIVLSFLTTGLLVTLWLKRNHQVELQKVKYQLELDRERARIAQDLHDDLGTSLTQISMLSALADRKFSEAETKSFNQQIRQQSREMVVALDEIVWAVNPRNDSLVELINYLGNFAEEFFRPTAIRCRLEIPDLLPVRTLSSETRHHLFLVFKESINNVARHSGASQIWIQAETTPAEVIIRIRDDGRGFSMSPGNFTPGDGLLNMKSRMEQVGGHVDVTSAPGQGTAVTIRLPMKPD